MTSIASDAPIIHPLFWRRIGFAALAGVSAWHTVRALAGRRNGKANRG